MKIIIRARPFIILVALVWLSVGNAYALPVAHTQLTLSEEILGAGIVGGSTTTTSLQFTITNQTGQTWTSFAFNAGGGGSGFLAGTYSGPGTATFVSNGPNPPTVTLGSITIGRFMQIDGINVLDGGLLQFGVDHICFDSQFSTPCRFSNPHDVLGTAGVAVIQPPPPASVPEPGTIILMGSGLAGMFAFRKKIRKEI